MTSHWDALAALFAANPLAQAVGLVALGVGILTFLQHSDHRLRLFLTLFSALIGAHFYLLGGSTAAFSAWLSGLRAFVSTRTRHVAVMLFFIGLVWLIGIPNITRPVQWLPVMGTTLGTWALFRARGIRMRAIIWLSTVCWMIHNYAIGSIGGAMIETCFLLVNGYTIYRLWQKRAAV
ncbi:MAG: YgjV family protein [Candidatus Competibacteraceae bacterium]|nr:YgjV family protein [Candidatus Competibacteraceae bacterium]MBK7984148.1 YgjV family protein [Candidatus Competibacteraceae bacterium]MBK8896122.1 YgjV family protein [Candidatus Competibacteraceae bacterium]MBK8964280.1 YgjV family protein [Candidatus Competibacteraceae bacterium]MBK9950353.1 YgjV family protein [Candidatus Competibacteraceae bacterium]